MRRLLLILLALGSGATVPLWLAGSLQLPPCPFAFWLHLLCPMCGSGRALDALTSGQVTQALQLNPLLGFWAGLLVLAWLELWAVALQGPHHQGPLRRSLIKLAEHPKLQGFLFAVVIVWTLYANVFNRSLLAGSS